MDKRRNTYEGYAFGCAAAWALILAVTRRRTDRETQKTIGRFCVGWWSGWISATIARMLYPPSKKLESEASANIRKPAAASELGPM